MALLSCPGLAFASAINSLTFEAGTVGLTRITSGTEATRLTGAKSSSESYGSFG
jgi:hypothetical protein